MSISVVVACNDRGVLQTNLLVSPLFSSPSTQLIVEEDHPSASIAYNEGLRKASHDWVVFVHQDVYLPRGWEDSLTKAILHIESQGINWAVLGVIGVTNEGEILGTVWSTGLGIEIGNGIDSPTAAVSLDEMILVLKKSSGITFDPQLPGYHLYGTDICQIAKMAGYESLIFWGPAIHNSTPVRKFDKSYWAAFKYLQKKWYDRLPIKTCNATIKRGPFNKHSYHFFYTYIRLRRIFTKKPPFRGRLPHPAAQAKHLKYELEIDPLLP